MRAIKNLFVLAIIVAILGGSAPSRCASRAASRRAPRRSNRASSPSSSVSSYVYGAKVGNKVILFDAGADPGGAPVDAVLGWLHARRGDVTDVFVTHGHGDHTAGVSGLGSAHVHLGAGDLALAEKKVPPEALRRQGVHDGDELSRRHPQRSDHRRARPSTSARARTPRR